MMGTEAEERMKAKLQAELDASFVAVQDISGGVLLPFRPGAFGDLLCHCCPVSTLSYRQ